jgi:hypothetical protein
MLVAKVRSDDGLAKTKELRRKVLAGEYQSCSIAGRPVKFEKKMHKGQLITYHYDIDPDEISLCRVGVNPRAKFHVIQKSGQQTLGQPLVTGFDSHATEQGKLEAEQLEARVREIPPAIEKLLDAQARERMEQLERFRKAVKQIEDEDVDWPRSGSPDHRKKRRA